MEFLNRKDLPSDLSKVFLELPALIDLLRGAGYKVGTKELLRLHGMLLELIRRDAMPVDRDGLRSSIAPVVCTTPLEQEQFEDHFRTWWDSSTPASTVEGPDSAAAPPRGSPQESAGEIGTIIRRHKVFVRVAAAAVVLLLLASVLQIVDVNAFLERLAIPTQEKSVHGPNELSKTILGLETVPFLLIVISLMLVAFQFLLQGWWRFQTRRFLRRHRTTTPLEEIRLPVERSVSFLFGSSEFDSAVRLMRKHRPVSARTIDIDRTAKRAAGNAGQYTPPEFGVRPESPEYLFLIDRTTHRDHQAHLAVELTVALVNRGLFVKAFLFDGDPCNCISVKPNSVPVSLLELQSRFPHHRLVVCCGEEILRDPIDGRLAPWVRHLSCWNERVLFAPMPLKENLSRNLRDSGFQIVHTSAIGLGGAFGGQPNQGVALKAHVVNEGSVFGGPWFPEQLERYEMDYAPPNADWLFEQLRTYLDPEIYFWLCACAVFPEITPDLTAYLGRELCDDSGDPLITEERYWQLTSLPWFRRGWMPDWIRGRLVEDLPADREEEVRRIIEELMLTTLCGPALSFDLCFSARNEPVLRRLAKGALSCLRGDSQPRGPFRDEILYSFVQNKLSVKVPRAVQGAVRRLRRTARLDTRLPTLSKIRPGRLWNRTFLLVTLGILVACAFLVPTLPAVLGRSLPPLILTNVVALVIRNLPRIEIRHSEVFRRRRVLNWLPLGLTYAFLYMGRYNLAVSKFGFESLTGDSGAPVMGNDAFGIIFGLGTVIYGLSFLLNGPLADRFGGRRSILYGAGGACLMNLCMGLVSWSLLSQGPGYSFFERYFVLVFGLLYALNMYFQSFGAVAVVKVNAAWFHVRERGVFGAIFGIVISLGIYFAFDWGNLILNGLGLIWVFFIPSLLLALFWIIDMIAVRNSPGEAGYGDFDTADASSGEKGPRLGAVAVFRMMLRNPIIVTIACVEFCSGFLRQAIMQWYRTFAKQTDSILGLRDSFVYENWGLLLCCAGIVGGVVAGVISDHVFQSRRGPVAVMLYGFMLACAIVLIFTYQTPLVGALVVLMSMAIIGVHGMLSGTASMDFGGRRNVGIAVGIIDGFVYLGTAVMSFTYAIVLPREQLNAAGEIVGPVVYPDNWLAWPLTIVPVAALGFVVAIRVWSAKPQGVRRN